MTGGAGFIGSHLCDDLIESNSHNLVYIAILRLGRIFNITHPLGLGPRRFLFIELNILARDRFQGGSSRDSTRRDLTPGRQIGYPSPIDRFQDLKKTIPTRFEVPLATRQAEASNPFSPRYRRSTENSISRRQRTSLGCGRFHSTREEMRVHGVRLRIPGLLRDQGRGHSRL